jgi:hypothetical protein
VVAWLTITSREGQLLSVVDALRLRYFRGDTNRCTLERMMLAGIPVRSLDVLELAGLLREAGFDDVAARLEDAHDLETKLLALTVPEREAIVRALDDPPASLAELRACSCASARPSRQHPSFGSSRVRSRGLQGRGARRRCGVRSTCQASVRERCRTD